MIVDVAEHARVSVTTVSKVLRNAYGASPAMRAKPSPDHDGDQDQAEEPLEDLTRSPARARS